MRSPRLPSVSVIITTYNREDALELTLRSALRQSHPPDEILIGDDGSGPATQEVVDAVARGSRIPIRHVWQEDQGFRLSRIRNLCLARATGAYVVLVDGDMVLHPRFVEDHLRAARAGHFSQGVRVLLGLERTRGMLMARELDVVFLKPGLRHRTNMLRSPWLSRLVLVGSAALRAHLIRSLRGIRGCNMGFWRTDLVRVNGFHEGFAGWGREDSELAVRLLNAGVRRQDLRFAAVAYHLHHPERARESLERNDHLLAEAVRGRSRWAEAGLDRHLG